MTICEKTSFFQTCVQFHRWPAVRMINLEMPTKSTNQITKPTTNKSNKYQNISTNSAKEPLRVCFPFAKARQNHLKMLVVCNAKMITCLYELWPCTTYIPLNWCWHSSAPSMWPSPSAINASGASLHNCRWADVRPGTRLQIIDDAKLHTIL